MFVVCVSKSVWCVMCRHGVVYMEYIRVYKNVLCVIVALLCVYVYVYVRVVCV